MPGSGFFYGVTITSPGRAQQSAWFVFTPPPSTIVTASPALDDPNLSFARVAYTGLGATLDSSSGLLQTPVLFRFGAETRWQVGAVTGAFAPTAMAQATFVDPLSSAGAGSFSIFGSCSQDASGFSCGNPITNVNIDTGVFTNIPEPASLSLVGLGLAAFCTWRKRALSR